MSFLSRTVRCSLFALLAVLGLGLSAFAQTQEKKEHYLTDRVAEEIKKLDEFQQKKQWVEAINFVNNLLKGAKADSFDVAQLNNFLGRIHYMNNDMHSAAAPISIALSLGVKYEYFKLDTLQELRLLLIQSYFTDAQAKGITIEQQKEFYLKCLGLMDEWVKYNTRPNPEVTNLHAYILFGLAQTNLGEPNKIDKNYIDQAQKVIERALTEVAKPKDVLYQLLIGCLQQRDDFARMSEIYEILIRQNPNNKQNWGTLFATYYQLSQDSNRQKAFDYSIRAIATLDRAQTLGHLTTQKDNFNRVAILFNIEQHELATEYLEKGLMDGSIEDIIKNWEVLAYSFQQIGKDTDAIRVIREAAKRYPDKGSLYMMMAQSFYSLDKPKESYDACEMALKVGNLEKPFTAHSFAANMAFQLREFENGLKHIQLGSQYPEAQKDQQMPRLKQALEEGIKERELNKKAIEAQHKNL